MKNLVPEHLGWRIKPGILGQHALSPQSVHALLGYFLKDRESPTPFPGRDRLAREGLFDWGLGPPLEKVIEGPQHLQHLLQVPELYRQSVAIIEPWPDVGTNPRGEQVRASKNIAYMLQQIADADTILYLVWRSGIDNPSRLANVLSAGIATVVQGGNPSVHDARSFDGGKAGLEDMLSLVDELLLRRSTGSGPSIFICLGHQLAAASHIRLVRRAAQEVLDLAQLPMDASGRALAALHRLCRRIVEVGESLPVIKSGEIVATGWNHPSFAVARNESLEIGTRRLMHYAPRGDRSHVPEELHATHALDARARGLRRNVPRGRGQRGGRAVRQLGVQKPARRDHSDAPCAGGEPGLVAAESAVRSRDAGADARGRSQLDRGQLDRDLLQGLGNAADPPLVHVPVPPGADGRHPRHRRALGTTLSGTEGERRGAALHATPVSRDAGVTAVKWWAV